MPPSATTAKVTTKIGSWIGSLSSVSRPKMACSRVGLSSMSGPDLFGESSRAGQAQPDERRRIGRRRGRQVERRDHRLADRAEPGNLAARRHETSAAPGGLVVIQDLYRLRG